MLSRGAFVFRQKNNPYAVTLLQVKNIYKSKINQQIRQQHVAFNTVNYSTNNAVKCLRLQRKSYLGAACVRFASTSEGTPNHLDVIPEPPVIPVENLPNAIGENVLQTVGESSDTVGGGISDTLAGTVSQTIAEPTFSSIGLGGWSPVGIIQNLMEYLHIGCDIPWWGTIAIGTVCVRIIIFPLVIMAQRNAAKMNNNLPQLQVLQLKMTEARQTGNQLDSARYAQEMMMFMKDKQLNPFKNMLVPLAQAPLFISFFMGLRQMANTPVDSMQTGGIFWFTNLTMPDQYFLLPVITSATMWLTIEVGTDSARLSAQNMQMMKYFLRALPVVIIPFTINFPGAILWYWACSNFISLLQVGVLRIPTVRDYFKIDPLVTHSADSLPIKSKGFVDGMKTSWTNMKLTRELEERTRIDELRFNRAGKGPIQKTYKHDPTRQKPAG